MMAMHPHKPTSSIASAEEQKSVQNWRSSPRSHILILNNCHVYIRLHVGKGTVGSAVLQLYPAPMLHNAGANSIFFIRAQICLRDKCIKLASRSCLGKRTVSRNHATLAQDCKGNKQFAKKGTVHWKNTSGCLCKHGRLRPSLANH